MKVLLDVGISPRLRSALSDALDGTVVESAIYRWLAYAAKRRIVEVGQAIWFTTLVTADKRLAQQQVPLPVAVVVTQGRHLER